ncbi:MAG TPA: OmpA family protein [Bacteroidia bacterium]|jgi:outer membrane protein OmpA-like peptidoglycan-associated protein|nr:OmpA family protein [Bacteroidia bacterium]
MKSFCKKYFLSTLLAFLLCSAFSQNGIYKPGDFIKESLDVYNVKGEPVSLKIPEGTYLIYYRYSWRDIGRGWGIETADSVKLLESKIAKILEEGEMHKLKVICVSYDDATYFDGWKSHVATNPFKINPKYSIEYYNTNGEAAKQKKCADLLSKITVFGEDGRLLRWSSFISKFKFTLYSAGGFKGSTIKAKLLTDQKGTKNPIENASVLLSTRYKNDTLSKATTDKYGDFQLYVPGNVNDYTIKVDARDKKVDNLLLVTQEGKEISNFEKAGSGFEYRLLKADIVTLSEVQTEDIKMKYDAFHISNEKELTTAEKIFYESGKSDIKKESEIILNHIVKILNDNPNVTLEVISHTDSQGDDKSNMVLSKKRALAVADYLIKNGIASKRIKTEGRGETVIINRCFNGVDCSDKEHEYNRRTEFKFIKH